MRITLPSGTAAALARPDGAERGLVVIPDIMGLRPLFDDMVDRLAADTGWAVCAAEPFAGHEDWTIEQRMGGGVADVGDERVLGDVVAAAEATGCDTVGVIGFCMGGMFTFKAAATGRFHRAVGFYGMIRLPEPWRGPSLAEPLDALASPERCPTMAVIGTVDPYTPPQDVADAEALGVHVVRYEGADHGFVHDPSRPAHRADDAADAWQRTLEFLGT
ncbi:dienelactone hydrolase family protein [Rhabdothermincola salaria]|uniref:dienelactone hydrolase family protein n=1 Tax=Rhabdothermincola salaria TaxID=2903142 RepID=UPI001E31C811|nr:dienelactone hydrolase family protein [Rhabdothermincola salaria]MCD9624672.1 dienelactone hydrolase family protein [Rhabdothermincola salaria]